MENLTIDLSQLQSAVSTYETCITEFETAFQELDGAMKSLKNTDWKSGASSQYFSLYDSSWKENMNRHLKIMEHLKDCLSKAQTEYDGLYGKVHTLGSNI